MAAASDAVPWVASRVIRILRLRFASYNLDLPLWINLEASNVKASRNSGP
jgi:hypothetical protein